MPLAGTALVHPRLVSSIGRFYPHTITIQRVGYGARDQYGSRVETWGDLTGHIDIPARVVSNGPGTGAGGWSGEIYAPTGSYDVDGRTMALQGYYPDISEIDRVAWAGLTYEIQAVESDAEAATTRLRTRKVR